MKKLVLAILALGLIAFATGCGHHHHSRSNKLIDIPAQPVKAKMSMSKMYKAIVRAATSRGWETRKRKDGLVEAVYARRDFMATVTIKYTTKSYDIDYKSSEGLRYDPVAKTIHRSYNSWVRNLQSSINSEISLSSI